MRLKRLALLGQLTVPLVCALAGMVLMLADPLPLQALRNAQFDQFQRWQPRAYTEAPVRIIDIDDESLTRLGQWPWPRTRLAELVERLRNKGVAVIGFDVVFAEPDRTSPQAMARLWGLQGALQRSLTALPDHDAAFAASIASGAVVLGTALQRTNIAPTGTAAQNTRPYRFIRAGEAPNTWLHPFVSEVSSLPVLTRNAAGIGAISFVPDGDGVVRRVPMVLGWRNIPVPSLAAETLRVAQGTKNYILKSTPAPGVGLQEIRIGNVTVPTTAQGEIWVNYSKAVPGRYIPAWKVFADAVSAEQLEGKLVLVGTSAQGLMDLRSNPLGRIMPGVEAHAQALEQILTGGGLTRPAWATSVEAMVLVLGCLLIGWLALRARALVAAALSSGVLAALAAGAWHAFSTKHLLLNASTPLLAIVSTFVLASLVHHLASERQQRWVKEAFSRYVSPNLVQHLVSHPGQLELGGRRQECSFIFTDLAGFTSLMEKIDPAEAVALLNAYLDQMIAIAFRHGGTLDRIVGDAVAIMFSAPVQQTDHRARAFACALEMNIYATGYSRDLKARDVAFGTTRIGIHSGEVIVGNFGGSTIFDYRALGDPVNTAARLESANKHLGTQICVSANTLSDSPAALVRPVGRLILKGKTVPLTVLEPVTDLDADDRAPLDAYQAAYQALCLKSGTALATFEGLAASHPKDPLIGLHLKRLRAGEHGDLIRMEEK